MTRINDLYQNQLEKDFIEFLSEKEGRSFADLEKIYLYVKKQFHAFKNKKYERVSSDFKVLYRIYYDIYDESSAVKAYQFYAPLHLMRYLSYAQPKKASHYLHESMQLIKKRRFKEFFTYAYRKLSGQSAGRSTTAPSGHRGIAQCLLAHMDRMPVVVDYGSGLGYVSFEIGKLRKDAKIFLVDIDCLIQEFAAFRFRKHGLDAETIPVTSSNIYPELPIHNICIATEVMEHLYQPLTAYQNICRAMEKGGLLYGNFDDHAKGVFHVSPDLSELRKKIQEDFEAVDFRCYRKLN